MKEQSKKESKKIIESNKKAYFDYEIVETLEAGIALEGSEVKSVKAGNARLRDSFCQIEDGEAWIKNMFISPYEKSSAFAPDPRRNRKLLLHRGEIDKLEGKIHQKGYTLVATKLYFSGNKVKVEVGLARGKKLYDKRETAKEKDIKRDLERQIKDARM